MHENWEANMAITKKLHNIIFLVSFIFVCGTYLGFVVHLILESKVDWMQDVTSVVKTTQTNNKKIIEAKNMPQLDLYVKTEFEISH